jgi:hypothetical protein
MVKLSGFKEYRQKLRRAPERIRQLIDAEVEDAARDWAERAVNSAPADEGFLRNGIDAIKNGKNWEVISRAAYSAYMEWGTGSLVEIPAEYSNYAQTFRGKTEGTFEQMLASLVGWVKRKGIESDPTQIVNIAFLIALKILRVGVRPHPFFFIHKAAIQIKLLARLKMIFKQV